MMSLKLPIPLPYDVIDAYLNEKFIFERPQFDFVFNGIEETVIIHRCRLFESPPFGYGYSNYMFNFRTDYGENSKLPEDAEGYVDTTHCHLSGSNMIFSNPPTDKEIDTWVRTGVGSRI